jgi:hypothetical protein
MKSALTLIPLALAFALLLPGTSSAQHYRSHRNSFSISFGGSYGAPSCGSYGYAPVVYQAPVSYCAPTYYRQQCYQPTYYQPTYYAPSCGRSYSNSRGRGRYR